MWKRKIASASLIVASLCCLVVAQDEKLPDDGNLGDLIQGIFQKVTTEAPRVTTKSPRPYLGVLAAQLEKNQRAAYDEHQLMLANNSGPPTYLGVNNDHMDDGQVDSKCVPYYQCRNGTIVDDGVGLIDIRGLGPCESYLDIYCKIPNIIKPDEQPIHRPGRSTGCGQRHTDGVGFRIAGQTDNESEFGEFPWMVAILEEHVVSEEKLSAYLCGGALIHPQAVLTAAHCVNGKVPSKLKIRAGEWDTQTKNELLPHQDRNVSQIVIHPNHHAKALRHDFAIIFLSSPVNYDENVDVVCLPEQNARFDESRCYVSGWGKDVFGKAGKYQVIMKKIDLPVVPQQSCQDKLRSTRLGQFFVLHESFMCAGGETGKDACKGDGGSPLVCPIGPDSRYVQAGIVAWGLGCGDTGIPGVYANVAGARDWIDRVMASHNLDINVYQVPKIV